MYENRVSPHRSLSLSGSLATHKTTCSISRLPSSYIKWEKKLYVVLFHQEEMDFVLANRVEDVLRAAFDDEFPGMAQATSSKL